MQLKTTLAVVAISMVGQAAAFTKFSMEVLRLSRAEKMIFISRLKTGLELLTAKKGTQPDALSAKNRFIQPLEALCQNPSGQLDDDAAEGILTAASIKTQLESSQEVADENDDLIPFSPYQLPVVITINRLNSNKPLETLINVQFIKSNEGAHKKANQLHQELELCTIGKFITTQKTLSGSQYLAYCAGYWNSLEREKQLRQQQFAELREEEASRPMIKRAATALLRSLTPRGSKSDKRRAAAYAASAPSTPTALSPKGSFSPASARSLTHQASSAILDFSDEQEIGHPFSAPSTPIASPTTIHRTPVIITLPINQDSRPTTASSLHHTPTIVHVQPKTVTWQPSPISSGSTTPRDTHPQAKRSKMQRLGAFLARLCGRN